MPNNLSSFTLRGNNGKLRMLVTPVNIHISGVKNALNIQAIWDTGATGSAITKDAATKLGLKPIGQAQVHTANGLVTQNTYMIDVGLPNNTLIQGITATEVDALSGNCGALIGMDVIGMGDLSITNLNGITCMSFRCPSLHEIDFVKEPNFGVRPSTKTEPSKHNNFHGTPRNADCPCGSGKKFKHCHDKK